MSHAATDVAIIGMVGRFPGAPDLETFWRNIRGGVDSIVRRSDAELAAAGVPAHVRHMPGIVGASANLDEIETFDAGFFSITTTEAEILDPQHRLLLECAWAAFEQAGYDPETIAGTVGVYAGTSMSSYLAMLMQHPDVLRAFSTLQLMVANDKDHVAMRVAYKLNLRGPAICVQSACSTSLVAVHLACEALLSRQCDLALAAGVTARVTPTGSQSRGYLHTEGAVTSPDGYCRPFDARANGTIFGNGIGVVLLKRLRDALADGDYIHAVIKGSAVNNDGSARVGYTAPSADGQAAVIAEALAVSGLDPESIGYIEAHGTGTSLGDPIEFAALQRVFRRQTTARGFCALGSVKANVGHLETAAGMAGLMKATLALQHREIPPHLHFVTPNANVDLADSPFYIPTVLTPWPPGRTPRRAGVSSFGMGGTNAHLLLEEAPPRTRGAAAGAKARATPSAIPSAAGADRTWHLLPLSARSESALEARTRQLAEALAPPIDATIADVAFTLQAGRRSFPHRRFIVCRDLDDARAALQAPDRARLHDARHDGARPSIAFMFPGQGAQYAGMARDLYLAEPIFREHVDRGAAALRALIDVDLRALIFGANAGAGGDAGAGAGDRGAASRALAETAATQPALFVIEYALARLLMAWGITPDALIGHSLGELVAATLAGVFTEGDALALVAARGRLMQQAPRGAMLAIPRPEAEVAALLPASLPLSIAAINGPHACVVSGPIEAIDAFERDLGARAGSLRRLSGSHAFHSSMMDPVVAPFTQRVAAVPRAAPSVRWISNVTGTWITDAEARDPAYWGRHLRQPVRFADGVRTLAEDPHRLFLEVGPGHTLSNLVRQPSRRVVTTLRAAQESATDSATVLQAIGHLWLAGAEVRHPRPALRVPLPTYPFERRRYWILPTTATPTTQASTPASASEPTPHDGAAPRTETAVATSAAAAAATDTATGTAVASAAASATGSEGAASGVGDSETINAAANGASTASAAALPAQLPLDAEQAVAMLWRELLGAERIGPRDHFFELGGDSVLATQMASRLRERCGVPLSLEAVLMEPTVQAIAARIRALASGHALSSSALAPRLQPVDRSGPLPLSFAQQRLFFLHQLAPDNPQYNVPVAVRIAGPLDAEAVVSAVDAIVQRHEILRTTLALEAGEPTQRVRAAMPPEIRRIDLSEEPEPARAARAEHALRAAAADPFDLARGPMLRLVLVRFASDLHHAAIVMPHIVCDAWSIGIILRELAALYTAQVRGEALALPPLPLQYGDIAVHERQRFQGERLGNELAYWTRRLSGASPLRLHGAREVADADAAARREGTGTIRLTPEVTAALKRLARDEGATLFTVLLSIFAVVLRHHSGQDDLVIGTDVANRHERATEGVVGFFVNQLVLRADLSANPPVDALVRRVHAMAIEAFAHQELPFDRLVEAINPARDARSTLLFNVKLVLQNAPAPRLELPGLTLTPIAADTGAAKFDLLFNLEEVGGAIVGRLDYHADRFTAAAIAGLLRDFETVAGRAAVRRDVTIADLDDALHAAARDSAAGKLLDLQRQMVLPGARRRGPPRPAGTEGGDA